ncbi:MAG: CsgG/HfaB family protein [Campylobacterota bacterium]|nr:CsgG/HfaB family protein [Campylobacterota bacterium]
MKKIILFLTTALFVLFASGCAQKVNIRALEPAEIDRAAATKKVAVASFKRDKIGLSGKIEAKLARFKIDNNSYFTIVSRNDFDKIVEEQKIQNSGLVDSQTVVDIGNLIGAQAIISGNVGKVTSQDSYFYERRSRCADKKCKELIYYKVRCMKRVVGLSAELRMVDVAQGDIIYADTLSKNAVFKHCSDDSRPLPSKEMAAQDLANAIANNFVYKLTPHYRNFRVVLLEDGDLDYNDRQERLLDVSLEYIEQGRFDKAERFLIDLIDSTNAQSYVAFYNLGVVKEAEGNYAEAKEYYENADNLMIEPVKEINAAVIRINSLIEKRKRTHAQMAR